MPVTILAVDDDDAVRRVLVGSLGELGYQVRAASSAEEALDLVRTHPFDLILSDVRMPGMSGMELSRSLTDSHPGLPVVLVTGYGDATQARTALRYGAADFVTKPFNMESLHLVVERNLERRMQDRRRAVQHELQIRFRVVHALAAVIDARQACTAEHSRRVADLAMPIGEEMGLRGDDLCLLQMASHVHDLGKIDVPEYILNKPGALTEQEWVPVRQHPVRGASIVGEVPEMACIAEVVRHHHERIDGGGYPDGLRGEAIPLLSRIIAVADAYDAMTSDRPYRSRMSRQQSLGQLTDYAGTQFDPAVVSAFMSLHRSPVPA